MPLKTWVPDEEITSDGLNSVPNVLNGTAGEPILLTGYSSPSNWNLTVRNQGAGGQALTILSSDGLRTLFSVTDAGPSLGASGIVFGPGSAANPSVGVGGTGQGLYSPGTAQVAVSVGGNEVARFGPNGLRLGTPAAPRTYLDLQDPFSAWTTDLVTPRYSSLFLLGAFDPLTMYQWHADGGGTNASMHGAVMAGVEIPSTAFKTSPHALTDSVWKAAVIGVARCSAPASSNPLGTGQYGWDGVGIYGGASALTNASEAFAANFLADDRAGLSHAYIWGIECDVNYYASPTRAFGIDSEGVFYVAPNYDPLNTNVGLDGRSAHAFRVGSPFCSSALGKQWTYGLSLMDGAAKFGIVLGTTSEGLNTTCTSQALYFRGRVADAVSPGVAGCYVSTVSGGPDGSVQLQVGNSSAALYVFRADASVLLQASGAGNAGALNGLSINQGSTKSLPSPATQATALWLASTGDVAHGMTQLAPTEVYEQHYKLDATNGGALIRGLTAGNGAAILYQACGVTDVTTQTSGSGAYMVIQAAKKSGTTVGSPGGTANLLAIGEPTAQRFFFRNDGNAYADTAWTSFDEHDDVALLDALERELDPVKAAFGEALRGYGIQDLERLGLIGAGSWRQENGETRAMLNTTRLLMLLTGALRQQQAQIATLTSRLELSS